MTEPPTGPLFDLVPHDMAHGGEAVARHEGKAFFVADAIPGETISARVVKDGGSWARAQLVEVTESSPHRIEPPCPHFSACGGCQWQYLAYDQQLEWKRQTVTAQLAHLGGLADVDVRPTIPSERQYGYRNRMDFHVRDGKPALYRRRTKELVPLDTCLLIVPSLVDLFSRLGPLDDVHQITLRASADEQMVVVRGAVPDQAGEWGCNVVRVRRGRPEAVVGRTFITEKVAGHDYRITGNAFFQNNTKGAEQLVEAVRLALDPRPEDVLLDGYAGGGLFSVAVADDVDEVIAVEVSPLGLRDLEHNLEMAAAFASIVPVPFERAGEELDMFDLAIADPPREGLGPDGVAVLVDGHPRTIALVSCDPAALARDAKALVSSGYELDWVQPIDLFPQTYHIETVSRFVSSSRIV